MGKTDFDVNNSRECFSKNLQFLMAYHSKSRKDLSADLGVSYYTLTDWCRGKKYPRVEKLDLIANYFGIPVSELVSQDIKNEYNKHISNQQPLANDFVKLVVRLHTDKEFLETVEKINLLDTEKFNIIKNLINTF